MKVAVIGSGAREHAIYWRLAREIPPGDIFVLPGNGGIERSFPVEATDLEGIARFVENEGIELIVVGPEPPLALGITDFISSRFSHKVRVFGPGKSAARLEYSKIFAKSFMTRHGVATARYFSFEGERLIDSSFFPDASEQTSFSGITEALDILGKTPVIKYDGLAAGKGVCVCNTAKEALEAIASLEKEHFSKNTSPFRYVMEEKLEGIELSIMGVTDGKNFRAFLSSQDHKRLLDGDSGPNTGGMGAIAPAPFVTDEIMKRIDDEIIEPTMKGLRREKLDYHGFIYFGIMLTENGPKLLEYNSRLGDPEAQVLLPSLRSSFLELLVACLDDNLESQKLEFEDCYHSAVVLASRGYPVKPEIGFRITGLEEASKNALVFHAGTKKSKEGLVTSGGRVLTVVAAGKTPESSIEKCYEAAQKIFFEGLQYRKDIGRSALKAAEKYRMSGLQGYPSPETSAKKNPGEKRIAILISGRGSNMIRILEETRNGILSGLARVMIVVSDRKNAPGIEKARALGFRTEIVESRNRKRQDFEEELLALLEPLQIDYVVLAGFMRILTGKFLSHYPKRVINIHPANPEEYRGPHGYRWAFENGLKKTFVTVHFVDEGVDTGEILAQKEVNLEGALSLEEVEKRGLAAEHSLYSETLAKLFSA